MTKNECFHARVSGMEYGNIDGTGWPLAVTVSNEGNALEGTYESRDYVPRNIGVKGKNPGVGEIVKAWLTLNGFDGLFSPGNCSCSVDDLAPCGDFQCGCIAGYFMKCASEDCDMYAYCEGGGCIGYDGSTCDMEG